MRALLTIVFTVLSFLAVPALVLATATPVYASGDRCWHSGDDCRDDPPPTEQVTVVKKDRFTGKDFGVSVVIGCGVTSLYQGLANNRWRWPYQWCLDLFIKSEPPAVAPPANAFGLNVEIRK